MKTFEQMQPGLNAWLSSKRGENSDQTSNSSNGEELKKEALGILEQFKNSLKGDERQAFDKTLKEIDMNAPEIRKRIAELVYEGKVSQKELQKILDNYISPQVASNGTCAVCAACSACVSCATCALCFISGIAVAAVTATIGTVSTVSAVNS